MPARKRTAAAVTSVDALDVSQGVVGIPWAASQSTVRARFGLPRSAPGRWHPIGRVHTLPPGIALHGAIRFGVGRGVDYVWLTGSAVHPARTGGWDSWRDRVGPAIDAWLAALGCVRRPRSLARVGALRPGRGEVAFDGGGGVTAFVVLQETPPVFTIGFVLA